jgi:superfamily II DNA helicase RecQ
MVQAIVEGKYQVVIVSPEIVISTAFRNAVLSKAPFYSKLRAVCIDEAHCISIWGGTSFRPEYAELGLLRGRFPSSIPFLISSATLPDHVLDDICGKMRLSKTATKVSFSNARPNVALSVRSMQYPEESKADLRFLIPPHATKPDDIDITLVYCNRRLTTEDVCDSLRRWAEDEGIAASCIAFYHAKIGDKRKHQLEEMLRRGEIRILVCTDAVGMVYFPIVRQYIH